jgi:2-hydroxychromene-2-carboxylate isomerase
VIIYFYVSYLGYAYLGSSRFLEIAAEYGRPIKHKPYDLRADIKGIGSKPPAERAADHSEYFFGRELERWSKLRNTPVMHRAPTHHHKSILEPNTLLITGIILGFNLDPLARSMMEQY